LKILSKLRKSEKGQSLVEFVLILPILLMLILGVLEFGWMLNAKVTVNSAAREGARTRAALGFSSVYNSTYETASTNAILEALDTSNITLVVSPNYAIDSDAEGGNRVTVTISTQVDPLIGIYINGTQTVDGYATMRLE
jgi:Flp pilus assembly protein TadG